MSPKRPNSGFSAPDLRRLDRLSQLIDLARRDRLEELFERLYQGHPAIEPPDAAERVVLAWGLMEHRQRDIFDLANRTLALFGLRPRPTRYPQQPWTRVAFRDSFDPAVTSAWHAILVWAQNSRYPQDALRTRFADLDEFTHFVVPRLALGTGSDLEGETGLSLPEHIVGSRAWSELAPRIAGGGITSPLGNDYRPITESCERALVVFGEDGPFPGLPASVDRGVVAPEAQMAVSEAVRAYEQAMEGVPF